MESEEITKLVDGVYKNILDKFNPGARQLIVTGKSYLKALHGAASASRIFNDALAKIAVNAQQSGTSDIGVALLNVVTVYKEIQEQQMNILKAFYVDLLVPLETNLEKDTKVVQHEQKKFLQQHKVRMESYQKAVSTMKKQRKKKSSPENTEKELKSLQLLEDQKKKLDIFCEQSYKNAMTQERRRYGFVLERQCSIAKHWMAYHSAGKSIIDNNLENWQEIAATREVIPISAYESAFSGNNNSRRMERIRDSDDSRGMSGGINGNGSGGGGGGMNSSQLKKSRSIDAPYGDMRTLYEGNANYAQNSLPRAKSDFNLTTPSNDNTEQGHWDQRPVVRALYAYMPSGENQLPFDEGDKIALVGSKAKGWQFGENLRTQMFGWFPIAYTNPENDERNKFDHNAERYENMQYERNGGMRNYHDEYISEPQIQESIPIESNTIYRRRNNSAEESSPTRMFGDTYRNERKYRGSSGFNPRPGPPPTLPAPVPTVPNSSRSLNTSQSFCASNGVPMAVERRKNKLHQNGGPQAPTISHMNGGGNQSKSAATTAKTSLHSSNDSGFANEAPPQPEVDYSDEEQTSRVPIRRRAETTSHRPRDVASWTLNRNFRNSVDSQIDDKSLNAFGKRNGKMRYDMIASDDELLQTSSAGGGIKRTKSFWKFGGRSEDILAGMSLWQHRDLVAAPNVDEMRDLDDDDEEARNEATDDQIERNHDYEPNKNDTLTKSNSNRHHSVSPPNENQRKDSVTSTDVYDDDENIYGISPVAMRENAVGNRNSVHSSMRTTTTNNFTPKSRMKIMKTIEIDIENPTESERLSTIKRGQREYQKEYRESASMLQQQQQQQPLQTSARSTKTNKSQAPMDMPSRNTMNGQKKDTTTHHSNQAHQMKSQRHNKAQEMQQFSDDERDSDDNGTLKMSDVNNFFDDMKHDGAAGGIIMKTVKRKDILKQYYTSEDESDDPEIKSTSSDPYDCIVINDHLVRKDEKHRRQMQNSYQEQQMEFQTFRATTTTTATQASVTKKRSDMRMNGAKQQQQQHQHQQQHHQQQQQQKKEADDHERYNSNSTLTRNSVSNNHNGNTSSNNNNNNANAMNTPTATILPRTRLIKSSNTASMTLERTHQKSHAPNDVRGDNSGTVSDSNDKDRHYGKTYGPWYDFWDQQNPHSLVNGQKSVNNSKMK